MGWVKLFDKKNLLLVIVTSFLLAFFNLILLAIYCFLLLIIILLLYKYRTDYVHKIKSIIEKSTLLISTIFLLVVGIEVYLHLAEPSFLHLNRSVIGDFSDFTSRGYLDKTVFHKDKNNFRLLGLGDSFAVFLYNEKKNYHDFLRSNLKSRGKERIEIINAGMETTGPGYYRHILEKYGDAFQPNLVLVGFFIGNDFLPEGIDFSRVNRGPFFSEPRDNVKRFCCYLSFKNLWLYKYLKSLRILQLDQIRRKEELRKGVIDESGGSASKETFLRIEREVIKIFEKGRRDRFNEVFKKASNVLLKMKNWCDERRIELVVAIFPDRFQIDEPLRRDIYAKYGIQASSLDLIYPNISLYNYCLQNNIHCIDMTQTFQEIGKSAQLYAERETHWNETGNRLAAEMIFDYLEKNRLLP
jgi:hypothetical protein